MSALQSAEQLRTEIETFLKKAHDDPAGTLGSDLDDYAEIGSLMTDLPRCLAILSQLNNDLLARARKKNMIDKKKENWLKHGKGGTVDHNKILTDAFAEFEAGAGFNKGIGHKEGGLPKLISRLKNDPKPNYMPSGPATLTKFVPPDDFRSYLLKHSYHWKDAGVGVNHGEFTHRLHWYIITKEYEVKNLDLKKTPIDLFKRLAESECVGQGNGLWDVLFDYTQGVTGQATAQQTLTTYRRPETLHKFLNEELTQEREDLWVLSQLIAGRTQKRRLEQDDLEANYAKEMKRYDSDRKFAGDSIFVKPSHEKRWGL